MLCDRSDHFTGHERCPTIASSPPSSSTLVAGAATPVTADDTSVTGITDRSRNRARRRRAGHAGAVLAEEMVEMEVSGKNISVLVEGVKRKDAVKDYRRGITGALLTGFTPKVDRKGKGRAVDEYEKAGPSSVVEIVEPAPSGIDKARVATPPTYTVDDDESMGFFLGLFAPDVAPPKSILKRCASDSDITLSAIKA